MSDDLGAGPEAVDLAHAAERLGVHYQTAYRWVREGRLPAVRVRGRYRLSTADLDAFARDRDQPRPPGPDQGRRAWDRLARRFHHAVSSGDERAAREVVLRLHAQGEALVEILERVFVPALRRVGEGWAAGSLTVAEEHRASEIVERVLASVDQRRPGRPRGTAVVAAPAGEAHGLPVALAAAALRAEGWAVEHLGADVPLADLAGFCARRRPDLVVLAPTMPASVELAGSARRRLAGDGHRVVVGGPGRSLVELVALARSARTDPRRSGAPGPPDPGGHGA